MIYSVIPMIIAVMAKGGQTMDKLKIIIHIEAEPGAEIIGIKEDFAAYCEKFGDVRLIEVEEESQAMTNFDRIKAMSIDEMADVFDIITEICVEHFKNGCFKCPVYKANGKGFCDKHMIVKWLESEIEADE